MNKAKQQFLDECGFPIEKLVLFVCDEISFVSTKFIGLVDKRLRQLTGHAAPFGGVAVVLAGDMRQLPPVSGQLWCADLVHSLYAPTCAGDGDAVVGSVDRGLAALRTMQLVQLTRLMRAMDDPSFVDAQIKMRRTNVVRPVDDALLNRLANPTLQYSAADINTDEAWRFAPHGVLSQIERNTINLLQLRRFARYYGRPLVKWKLPHYKDIGPFGDDEVRNAALYEHEDEMWGYWCFGAPVQLTDTVRSTRGMANGSLGLLDSLVFEADVPQQLATALQMLGDGHRYAGPEIEVSVPYGVVIRISGTKCSTCKEKQSVFARSVEEPACWCADCAKSQDGVVRVGAPRWHCNELPDVLARIKNPIVEGEGLVVVTIDGPTVTPSKPIEVKLQR